MWRKIGLTIMILILCAACGCVAPVAAPATPEGVEVITPVHISREAPLEVCTPANFAPGDRVFVEDMLELVVVWVEGGVLQCKDSQGVPYAVDTRSMYVTKGKSASP